MWLGAVRPLCLPPMSESLAQTLAFKVWFYYYCNAHLKLLAESCRMKVI